MLNAMREGAKSGFMKLILMGLMVMAVGGLVLMDVGGFFRGGTGTNNVAKIEGQEFPAITFDRTMRRVLARQGLDVQTAYQLGLVEQILNNEISNNLLQRAAYDTGLQVGSETIARQINQLVAPYVTENVSKKEAVRRILMSQNMTEGEFIRALRSEMTGTVLRTALILPAAYASSQAADDIYQFNNEQRTVKGFFLPNSAIKDFQEPSDEVLLPFYQAGQERYAIPETRVFTMAILTGDKLKETLDISDEELRATYESEIQAYQLPERRKLEQAVFSDEATAKAVIDKLNKGVDMKQAVKDVTNKTDAYLGTEDFEQAGLLEEIGVPVYAAAKGDIVGPIKTALGWHALIVKDILPPKTRPFDDVKAALKKELMHTHMADQMFEHAGQIDDALAGGATLEDVAEEMGLKLVKIGPVREDGSTPDDKDGLKDYEADRTYILETAYEMMEGETSPVMEMADGRYMTLRVDTLMPKSYTPFEDVKKSLRDLWVADQQQVLNKQKAQDALLALLNGEKTLSDLAKENGVSVKTYSLSRSEEAPAPLTAAGMNELFTVKKDDAQVVSAKDGLLLGQVTTITLPDPAKADKDTINGIKDALKGSEQQAVFATYLQSLHNKYKVTINHHLLDRLYGAGSEQY
ncbi:MAG: peptidyl-prolyl cis-trans isomerase [Rhodospirillales bacterium]|nr:peptidyl-prolyl cis-trans isomerase [Rhodospirillales bacterium]